MVATGEEPDARTGPDARRFGPDLKPRVAAAVAMGASRWRRHGSAALSSRRSGGSPSVAVLWEWQRLVGGARLIGRVAVGALALALAPLFALHYSILGAVAALVLGAAAVGWVAGRTHALWAAAGALYAGALVASLGLLRASPSFGLAAILWLFAVVWGSRRRGLFRRPADRRPRGFGRAFRRARPGQGRSSAPWPGPPSASPCGAGRTASRRCSGLASRRRSSPSSATCSNPRSNGVSGSRTRAASSPATAD